MRFARYLSVLCLAACGDDAATTPDVAHADAATTADANQDDAATADTATAQPDTTAADDATTATTATTATDTTTATTPSDATATPDATTSQDATTVADSAADADIACVAGSSAPLPGKLAPVVARVEAKDDVGAVVASDDCVPFVAHADTHVVLARNAADSAYAVFAKVVATDDLAADRSRVAFGSFAPAAGGDVRFTYGPLGPRTGPGSVQRFAVDDPTALHHLRPSGGTGFTPVPPGEHGERALVFGLNGLVGSGDADWLEPVEETMAVRAFQFTVGPQHVFLDCASAATCEADVAAGTATDLGSDNSLAAWHRVPLAASVKLWAKSTSDGSVTFDGVTIPLGSAGDHHTLIGLMRADGVAVWQDFATAPPALAGQQVVDVFHANPGADLQFWLEDRRGVVVARSSFSDTRDLAAGQYVVRAYSASVDLAANDPAAFDGYRSSVSATSWRSSRKSRRAAAGPSDCRSSPASRSPPARPAPATCAATGPPPAASTCSVRGSCGADARRVPMRASSRGASRRAGSPPCRHPPPTTNFTSEREQTYRACAPSARRRTWPLAKSSPTSTRPPTPSSAARARAPTRCLARCPAKVDRGARASKAERLGWPRPSSASASASDRLLEDERAQADAMLREERAEHVAQLAEERQETDRDLSSERARADGALAMRDEFLGIVSHDLRNLLNSTILFAGLIADAATREQVVAPVHKYAKRIERLGFRMSRLVGDLLDVASIEAGSLAVTRELQDAGAVVTEAVDTMHAEAALRGVALEAELTPEPELAAFDYPRILQVLVNLVSNAIKFTPAGGKVVVRVARGDGELRIAVVDDGIGIAPDKLEVVFERFLQVVDNDRRGVGLGLYISKCIVQGHRGRIWAESRVGQGSTFCFTLPLAAG
ncbi:MAG: ATP-binding protein [Myxococcota bacterium]